MKKLLFILYFVFLLSSCSTSKLTQQYVSPEALNFQANKVLVIGIAPDSEIRRTFERKLTDALEKKEVIAVKSIDFFENSFTDNKKSIEQLNQIETLLLEAGFDAILFAKVTRHESRVNLVQSYRNFAKSYETFQDYYYSNQHIFMKEQSESYQVYSTETSLFCICPGKERELLWRGDIDIIAPERPEKSINDYIKTLLDTLEKNKILIL